MAEMIGKDIEQEDFRSYIDELRDGGIMKHKPLPMRIQFPYARKWMEWGLEAAIGKDYEWLPEYDQVVDWLTDNHNKGLFLMGSCGRGKTVIASQILPVILNRGFGKVLSYYNATDLAKQPDTVIKNHIMLVDDIGVEGIYNEYGNKRIGFAELCDAAEKKGKLLILTSNLNKSELKEKYDERTMSRLRYLTTKIVFKGKDLRK